MSPSRIFAAIPKKRLAVVAFCLAAPLLSQPAAAATKFTKLASLAAQNGPVYNSLVAYGGQMVGSLRASGCCGALFALTPPHGKTAAQITILHNFGSAIEGLNPGALMVTQSGIVWGVTGGGGAHLNGTLFSYSPAVGFQKQHDFGGDTDGYGPVALTEAANGMIYGITQGGGTNVTAGTGGTIFRFDPASQKLTTLYSFSGGTDGGTPLGAPILDAHKNLVGTTSSGGDLAACTVGCGTVYRFNPTTKTLTTLHSFANTDDGAIPYAGLTAGPAGTAYGTTTHFGKSNGSIFQIDLKTGTLTTLHAFKPTQQTGGVSFPMILATDGSLLGTAPFGGKFGEGKLFRFDPVARLNHGLYNFTGETNGAFPYAGLAYGADGNLYGGTAHYGDNAQGTLYRISYTPAASP